MSSHTEIILPVYGGLSADVHLINVTAGNTLTDAMDVRNGINTHTFLGSVTMSITGTVGGTVPKYILDAGSSQAVLSSNAEKTVGIRIDDATGGTNPIVRAKILNDRYIQLPFSIDQDYSGVNVDIFDSKYAVISLEPGVRIEEDFTLDFIDIPGWTILTCPAPLGAALRVNSDTGGMFLGAADCNEVHISNLRINHTGSGPTFSGLASANQPTLTCTSLMNSILINATNDVFLGNKGNLNVVGNHIQAEYDCFRSGETNQVRITDNVFSLTNETPSVCSVGPFGQTSVLPEGYTEFSRNVVNIHDRAGTSDIQGLRIDTFNSTREVIKITNNNFNIHKEGGSGETVGVKVQAGNPVTGAPIIIAESNDFNIQDGGSGTPLLLDSDEPLVPIYHARNRTYGGGITALGGNLSALSLLEV